MSHQNNTSLQVTREVAKRTDDLTHQVHRETLSRSIEQVKTLAPILICSMKIFIQIIQQGKEHHPVLLIEGSQFHFKSCVAHPMFCQVDDRRKMNFLNSRGGLIKNEGEYGSLSKSRRGWLERKTKSGQRFYPRSRRDEAGGRGENKG